MIVFLLVSDRMVVWVLNPVSAVIFSPHTGQEQFCLRQMVSSLSRPFVLLSSFSPSRSS